MQNLLNSENIFTTFKVQTCYLNFKIEQILIALETVYVNNKYNPLYLFNAHSLQQQQQQQN